MRPRPIDHLESVSRDYPGIWPQYDRFLGMRGRGLPEWPSWCHCPMAAAYAIVSGGGDARVSPARSLEIARVAALAAWRPTQGIYRFDVTLLAELLETPVTGDLPTDHLLRLPEWCVYVELPESTGALGFFAHLEWDANTEETELRLLLDRHDGLLPLALHLGGTIEASVASFVAHASSRAGSLGLPIALGAEHVAPIANLAAPLVSVLLYLCAGDAELRPTRGVKRPPGRPQLRNGRMPPARGLEVYETGFGLGKALREAREAAVAGTHRGPRPHVRRAHWRNQAYGPKHSQHKLLWIHPTLVGVGGVVPTIRHVKTPEADR